MGQVGGLVVNLTILQEESRLGIGFLFFSEDGRDEINFHLVFVHKSGDFLQKILEQNFLLRVMLVNTFHDSVVEKATFSGL